MVHPRILAATLRTALDGWVKSTRVQPVSSCVLGCGGPNSKEHYAGCRLYHGLSSRLLGLAGPAAEYLTNEFVGVFAASTLWANPSLDNDEVAALRAIVVYALYWVHGAVRRGADRADASELFRGYLRQATELHPKSRALVSRAFKRPRGEA